MKITSEKTELGTSPMGTPLEMVQYRIDSGKNGPAVYIQSGVHGGEITQWIIHRLYAFLKDNLAAGTVTLVPCANPAAWLQREYFSTNGKFDLYMGKDWNRNFPGKADGTLGERTAAGLFAAASRADLVLDMHTSRQSIPFGIFTSRGYLGLVKTLGLGYNQFLDIAANPAYKDTLNACLDNAGVENLCIECGSHDAYEPENVAMVTEGIKRLLAQKGMIDAAGIAPAPEKVKVFSRLAKYTAPTGCLIRMCRKPGQEVCRGEDLFCCFDNGKPGEVMPVVARHDGVVLKVSPTYIYWSGDEVVQLIDGESVETV